MIKTFGQWIVYCFARIVICFLQSIRIETCDSICRCLAWLSYRVLKLRRNIIDENIVHAFPDWSSEQRQALALGMWHHVFLLVCELAQVPRKIHETNWRNFVDISDDDCREQVTQMLSDRPVVVVSGHFGNFEVGGVISGLLGFPTYTVARPLDNPFLHRFINSFRGATGQFMLPKKGSAPLIQSVLEDNGTLVLLGDQSAGPSGCWINFFNRPASCHKAVALFSLLNDAPMILAYSVRSEKPMNFRVRIKAVFDPREHPKTSTKDLTQWYSDQLEAVIRTAPEQYWWLHRRWKPRRRRKKKNKNVQRIDSGSSPRANTGGNEKTTTMSAADKK